MGRNFPPLLRVLLATLRLLVGYGFVCGAEESGEWKFVSIPDLINYDVGSIKNLPAYDGGADSSSPEYEALLGYVLDSIRAENPDFVLVAGDLVMGHWDRDWDNRKIFGPVGTGLEKSAAIWAAGNHYYGLWKERFSIRGLEFHVALGDHEIGDNDWTAINPKSRQVGDFKNVFARNFMENPDGTPKYRERPVGTEFERTAYAFRHKNALFITVDVFLQRDPWRDSGQSTGTVIATVADGQLEWLRRVLAEANADPSICHIIVQGHVPVLRPTRAMLSSAMSMQDENGATGAATAFWRTLADGKVDLYLCGEVHDVTASKALGVNQIAHGALVGQPMPANYLLVGVKGDALDLQLKSIPVQQGNTFMWQTHRNRPYADCRIDAANRAAGFKTTGTLVLDKSELERKERNRTGRLGVVGSAHDPLLVHLSCDSIAGGRISNTGETGANNLGVVWGSVESVPGKLGQAIRLGANGIVTAGATPVHANAPRTISFWVKTTGGAPATVLGFGVNGNASKWDIDITSGGSIEVGMGGGRLTGATPKVNTGQWHHVLIRYPGEGTLGETEIHIDGGEAIAMEANATRPATSMGGQLTLGSSVNGWSTQKFQGALDDVAIWGRELLAAEARAVHSLAVMLGFDARDSDEMLIAFRDFKEFTDSSGRKWFPVAFGMNETEGEVLEQNGIYRIHLGSGGGMMTRKPEEDAVSLHVDFEVDQGRILRSRVVPGEGIEVPSASHVGTGRIGRGLWSEPAAEAWDLSEFAPPWEGGMTVGFWFKYPGPGGADRQLIRFSVGGTDFTFGDMAGNGRLYFDTGGERREFHAVVGDGNWHHFLLSKSPAVPSWKDLRLVVDGLALSLAGCSSPWPTGGVVNLSLGGSGHAGRWDDVTISRKPVSTGEARLWHELGRLAIHSSFGAEKINEAVEASVSVEGREWRLLGPVARRQIGRVFQDPGGELAILTSTGRAFGTVQKPAREIRVTSFTREEAMLEMEWLARSGLVYGLHGANALSTAEFARVPATEDGSLSFRLPLSRLGGCYPEGIQVREVRGPWSPPLPRILSARPSAKSFRLKWSTRMDGVYKIQASANLREWAGLPISPFIGNGDQMEAVIAEPEFAKNRFYRISETSPAVSRPPAITGFDALGSAVDLEWTSSPGRQYRLLVSSDLLSWSVLGQSSADPSKPATRRAFAFADKGGRTRFFRVNEVTTVPLLGRRIIPGRMSLTASVRADRTYRLSASPDLEDWSEILARDLGSENGILVQTLEDSTLLARRKCFFRFEEE